MPGASSPLFGRQDAVRVNLTFEAVEERPAGGAGVGAAPGVQRVGGDARGEGAVVGVE